MGNVAIIGGSRGIGEAVARHLVARSERIFSVSRSVSKYGEWIKADVTTLEGVNTVAEAAGEGVLDSLLYMGGTWDKMPLRQHILFQVAPTMTLLEF